MSAEKRSITKNHSYLCRTARAYRVLNCIIKGENRHEIRKSLIAHGFNCQTISVVNQDVLFLKELGYQIKSSHNARVGYKISNPEKDYFQTIKDLVLCQRQAT